MSETPETPSAGWRYTGYGRTWSEEKASGLFPRLRQIMREPATKTTYYISGAICIAIWFAAAVFIRVAI